MLNAELKSVFSIYSFTQQGFAGQKLLARIFDTPYIRIF